MGLSAAIICVALVVLLALSARADRVYNAHDQLPMQFGLNGAVGWSAPRRWALSFSPALAVFILVPTALVGASEGVLVFVSLCMIGGHAFHIWLIDRAFRRGDE